MSLDRILCLKYRRKVSRDNTVKYNRRTLQLLPDVTRPTYAAGSRLRSRRTWMVGSWGNTKGRLSVPQRLRHVRAC